MELEKKIIVDKLSRWSKEDVLDLDHLDEQTLDVTFEKDSQESESLRVRGNKLFSKKSHDKKIHENIWMLYTKSIALALNDSEQLAAAYANRSALLLHLRKYEECLSDVERALKITKSSSLKVKLFCRQTECYVYLQEGNTSSSLTKAKFWLQKIDKSYNVEKLNEIISKTEIAVKDNIPDLKKKENVTNIPYSKDFVDVRYSKKYGKHFFATKDIQPGEFIYAEKFYATSVNSSKNYAYCSHCLAISWTLIPCNQCSFYMFCSQKCKSEAWEQYHDMECLVKFPYDSTNIMHYYVQLSIKSVIMGIKQTGSIQKLKDLVSGQEKKDAKISKGSMENMKFPCNSIQELISLASSKSEEKLSMCAYDAVRALIKLIENAGILQHNFEIGDDLKDLLKYEDVIFTGTLLLRLMSICILNSQNTLHFTEACNGKENYGKCLKNFCCSRGRHISLSTGMIHHNCNNNVRTIFSNDGRVMYYAVQPINKNSQITMSYCANFGVANKVDRQRDLKRTRELDCNCTACQEDWPLVNLNMQPETNVLKPEFMIFKSQEKTMSKIFKNPNYRPSKKAFNEIVKCTGIVFKITSQQIQPNPIAYFFTYILTIVMEYTYCQTLCIQDECK